MATITQQQLRESLLKAPAGTTPQGIINALHSKGHTIEGMDAPTVRPTLTAAPEPEPTFGQRAGDLNKRAGTFVSEQLAGRVGADRGFLGELTEATVGSRGLLGAFQLPGAVAGQAAALGTSTKLSQAQQGLADRTTELIKQARAETDPTRKAQLERAVQSNLQQLQQGQTAQTGLQEFVRTPGQAVGIAASAATTVGAGAVPGVSGIARTGLVGVAQRTGARGAINFGTGAVVGAGEALSRGESAQEALEQGLKVGGLSAVLGAGFQGGREVFNLATTPELLAKVFDNAIGVSGKTAVAGKSPSSTLIKEGVIGTARNIHNRETQIVEKIKPQIQRQLAASNKTITASDLYEGVANQINRAQGNVPGEGVVAAEIRDALASAMPNTRTLIRKEVLTLPEANQLRQLIDKTRTSTSFLTTELPQRQQLLKGVADGLRGTVQDLAPATKELFKRESVALTALAGLNKELNKPRTLRHMLALMTGIGGLATVGPSGLLGALGFEAVQTTVAKTGTAVGLAAARKATQKVDASIKAQLVKNLGRLTTQKGLSGLLKEQ